MTTTLLDLPAEITRLCLAGALPSYIAVRNAARACRALRTAAAATIDASRDAQRDAIADAVASVANSLAAAKGGFDGSLCGGAMIVVAEPPLRSRRVIRFELALTDGRPTHLWSNRDVIMPLLVKHAAGEADRFWMEVMREPDSNSHLFLLGTVLRISRISVGAWRQQWLVSFTDDDLGESLLAYLIAVALDVCCAPADRIPYLHSMDMAYLHSMDMEAR